MLAWLTVLAALIAPSAALGHAGERGFVMLLPTDYYVTGGTLAVLLTFVAVAWLPGAPLLRLAAARRTLLDLRCGGLPAVLGATTLAALVALIVAGHAGSTDPLRNPLSTGVWSLLWVGMAFVQVLAGNIWSVIQPWRVLHRLTGGGDGAWLAYPRWLGYWPAAAGLFALVWYENISLAPMDPGGLARVLTGYLLFTALAMRLFGRDAWLRHAEVLSVYFRVVAWLAPLVWTLPRDAHGRQRLRLQLTWPAARLLEPRTLPPSAVLFVLLALASLSFDGLSHTWRWMAWVGINPLAFPGRSAVTQVNTLGLIGACALLGLAYYLAVWTGARLVRADAGRFAAVAVLSLVPIAFGYHLAHYLPAFLVEGQYALRALSDPLGRGWNLFGTGALRVRASLGSHGPYIELIWYAQVAAIVAGHMLAVVAGHAIASRLTDGRWRLVLLSLPLTALMVAYTLFGLWLLATPTV